MPNPFDRLKAALADRYAIREELGAGGMATVRPLFVAPGLAASFRAAGRNYDVTSDGTRFVLRVTKLDAVPREVHVVLNFFEELRAKVGN